MITLKNIILPILIALLAISILYGFIRFLLRIIGISTSFTNFIFTLLHYFCSKIIKIKKINKYKIQNS